MESALRGALDHTPHDNSAGQVEPHEQVRTLQEQRPSPAVLPLGHPCGLSSEESHIHHEAVARRPVGSVVQRVNLCMWCPHSGGDAFGEGCLTRAGRARDEDSPRRRPRGRGRSAPASLAVEKSAGGLRCVAQVSPCQEADALARGKIGLRDLHELSEPRVAGLR